MSPEVWTAPAVVAAGVLVLAGAAKVARPDDTARVLRATGIPGGSAAVRVGALFETGVGGWALVTVDPVPMALVASSYVVFTAFLVLAMVRSLPVSSCGCFGEPDVPPTGVHVGVDLAAAAAAAGAAITGAPAPASVMGEQPLAGAPYAVLVVVAISLAVLTLTRLPRLRVLGEAIGGRP